MIVSKPSSLRIRTDQLDRDGGGAGDGEPQRRHVELVEVGVVEDGLVDARAGRAAS